MKKTQFKRKCQCI